MNDIAEGDNTTVLAHPETGGFADLQYFQIDGKDFIVIDGRTGWEIYQIDPVTKTIINGTDAGDNPAGAQPVFAYYYDDDSNEFVSTQSHPVEPVTVTDSSGVTHTYFYRAGGGQTGGTRDGDQLQIFDYNHSTDTFSFVGYDGYDQATGDNNLGTSFIDNSTLMMSTFQAADGNWYGYGVSTTDADPVVHKLVLNADTGHWEEATTSIGTPIIFDTAWTGSETSSGSTNFTITESFEVLTGFDGKQYLITDNTRGFSVMEIDASGNIVANSASNFDWFVDIDQPDASVVWSQYNLLDSRMLYHGTRSIDPNGNVVIAGEQGVVVINPTTGALVEAFDIGDMGGAIFENPDINYTADGEMVITSTSDDGVGPGDPFTTVIDLSNYTVTSSGYDTTWGYDGPGGSSAGGEYGSIDAKTVTLTNGETAFIQMNTYASNSSDTTYNWITISNTTADFICFVAGTLIDTLDGPKPVEALQKGDLVRTKDNGFKPVMWIGKNTINLARNPAFDKIRPIRIKAGALGNGLPEQDLYVSQQHRVLLKSRIAARMMGFDEVLVPAKKLLDIEGIDVVTDCDEVTYVHFLFDQHEIVYSNGAETESLFTGPEALKAVSKEAREEILTLFPELIEMNHDELVGARIIPSGKIANKLVSRIRKNNKALYEVWH